MTLEARMGPEAPSRLDASGPRVGFAILFEGQEWRVTGQSSYWAGEGYRVHEWCCQAGDSTGYLLKEADPTQGGIRWFFTREIPADSVAGPGGEGLAARLGRAQETNPPEVLTYQDATYHYADTTDGTHEDESGRKVRKITWDYWDAARARNLAVERWPDGSFDCYLGAYIEPGQVQVRPAAAPKGLRPRLQANPFLAAAIFLPCAYLLAFVAGRPFDEGMALALPLAAFGGWLMAMPKAPAAGGGALLAAPAVGAIFWRFPPLTTGVGLVVLFGAPAAIAAIARRRGAPAGRLVVTYMAAFAVGAPLLVVGLYAYFGYAPGPHTPDQLALALGPAVLGSLAACLASRLVLGGDALGAR